MPAVLVVDPDGIVRAAWYGESMRDIPSIEEVLAVLDSLGASV
jgi:peroxiredoxin